MNTRRSDPKRLVAESYDRIAERYLEWRAQQHREGAAPWIAMLRERLEPGAKVLDLGCGGGIPLTRALAQNFDVTGVDISARQVELARVNVVGARFINADITAVDFPSASFDAVVGSYSFIHVPRAEHAAVLGKVARWLKPGGLLLGNFGIGNLEADFEEDWLGVAMFWSSFDADGARAAVVSAGFELVIDRIDTEIEDGRPHRWLLILARTPGAAETTRNR